MNPLKIIVTGHTGLIGSHLVDKLVDMGHTVYGMSQGVGSMPGNENPNTENYCINLLNKEATAEIIEDIKPDMVYHLAANAAEGKSQFSPIDITQRNVNIMLNVLVPAIRSGMRRFVYTSSIAAYGAIIPPFKESDYMQPQDIYGINKMACEKIIKVMAKVHGFEPLVFRPHNVYGPRQNMKDPYRNVVTLFMNQILQGKPYSIYGDGSMKRCFSYVGDVAQVLADSAGKNMAYMALNVGADKSYSIKELSDMVIKVSGTNLEPNYLPDRPQEVHEAIADHSLMHQIFEYGHTPLEDGIRRTWEWAKTVGPVEYEYTGFEIESNKIPNNWR
jgi:UDP-glucose 4-epimerase